MKELPILFSAPMVKAILAGHKTQTRRVIKPQPPQPCDVKKLCGDTYHWFTGNPHAERGYGVEMSPRRGVWRVAGAVWAVKKLGFPGEIKCPYGAPGDRLWVKESWSVPPGYYDLMSPREIPREGVPVRYSCDGVVRGVSKRFVDVEGCIAIGRIRSPLHMPRWASRLTLEVTRVRVELLHDITEEDARAEGVAAEYEGVDHAAAFPPSHCLGYRRLWDEINGPGAFAANPWVWVVDFARVL